MKIHRAEKAKNNEKAEELVSIERTKENNWKKKWNRNKQFIKKRSKTLVIRMMTGLWKIIDEYNEHLERKY